jgi:hypothetical protein
LGQFHWLAALEHLRMAPAQAVRLCAAARLREL